MNTNTHAPTCKPLPICLVALILALPLSAVSKEVLTGGDFAGAALGAPPERPWIVNKPQPGITVEVAKLPAVPGGAQWVHLKDTSSEQPAGIRYDFDPIQSGKLTFKLYFERIGSAFGVYLGDKKVSDWETRIIDMKILTNGHLSVADQAERKKTGFQFQEKKLYSLYLAFKPNASSTGYEVEIGDAETGEKIHSYATSKFYDIKGMRITTDTKDVATDVYITGISLAN